MKKLIILLLVISATALSAQDYQYFTAKQGIPKALEIAKQYFQSDSVNLYSIKCVRWKWIQITDTFTTREMLVIIDSINPYNDSTGKSLYWYYLICDSNDSCNYFRVWNRNGNFEYDSVFNFEPPYYYKLFPLVESDILVDTDSLVKCLKDSMALELINYSELYWLIWNSFGNEYLPIWVYRQINIGDISGIYFFISTKTCEYDFRALDVSEKNNSNSSFTIKSDPNTDNITIELNSDLIQNAELSLYNQVGVLLFADKLKDKSYQLSTYNYPLGMYLLQIKYGGNVITKTVMIVH